MKLKGNKIRQIIKEEIERALKERRLRFNKGVEALQKELIKNKFLKPIYKGQTNADGMMGDRTRAAMELARKVYGDIPGPKLLAAMRSHTKLDLAMDKSPPIDTSVQALKPEKDYTQYTQADVAKDPLIGLRGKMMKNMPTKFKQQKFRDWTKQHGGYDSDWTKYSTGKIPGDASSGTDQAMKPEPGDVPEPPRALTPWELEYRRRPKKKKKHDPKIPDFVGK